MEPLTISQIEEARVKILENAAELVEEATLLLANNRFARAYSLAHLACEEMAKIPMLVRAGADTIRGRTVDWKKLDRRFRSHKEKIAGSFHIDYLIDPRMENDEDIKFLQESLARVGDFNKMKNESLYVTFVGNSFVKPSEVINADLAAIQLKVSLTRLRFLRFVETQTRGKLEGIAGTPDFEQLMSSFEKLLKKAKDDGDD